MRNSITVSRKRSCHQQRKVPRHPAEEGSSGAQPRSPPGRRREGKGENIPFLGRVGEKSG